VKAKTMLKKIRLTEAALDNISGAVKKAESRTTGEIALALTSESASYSFWELLFAVIAGAFAFFLMLPLAGPVQGLLNRLLWSSAVWHLPAFFGITCFGLTLILFPAANIPAIDRLIVPRRVRSRAVLSRAEQHFMQCGVCNTRDRSGVLIFMSYLEREVRIIADVGLSGKISNDLWGLIAEDFAAGIGREDTEAAFIRAVERCGELLAQHFPADESGGLNPDEVSNHLFILEDAL
jgi:putative membrane protein